MFKPPNRTSSIWWSPKTCGSWVGPNLVKDAPVTCVCGRLVKNGWWTRGNKKNTANMTSDISRKMSILLRLRRPGHRARGSVDRKTAGGTAEAPVGSTLILANRWGIPNLNSRPAGFNGSGATAIPKPPQCFVLVLVSDPMKFRNSSTS